MPPPALVLAFWPSSPSDLSPLEPMWLTLALGLTLLLVLSWGGESAVLTKGAKRVVLSVKTYLKEHVRLVEEAMHISHIGSSSSSTSKGSCGLGRGKMREVTLSRILKEARRQIRLSLLVPATLFSILLAVVNMTEPMIIGRFWDSVEAFKTTKDLGPPLAFLARRAGLVVARYLLQVTVGILFARARCDMTLRLRHEVFARLLRRDTSFYEGASSSELLERLRRDPEAIEAFVNHACERIFQSVIDILCGLYLIMNYPWYLWGGSIIFKALPVTLITIRAGRLVSMYSVVQRHSEFMEGVWLTTDVTSWWCLTERHSLQQADAVAAEALGNIVAVRTHAAEAGEELRHNLKTRHYQDVLLHTLLTENLFRHLRFFTRQTMELGFVVLGAYCMVHEGLSMGRLLAFRSCLDMFIRGFNTLSELYAQACKLRRTSVRYFDLMDVPTTIEDQGGAAAADSVDDDVVRRGGLKECQGHLRVEHVSFSYPARSNTVVLSDVSLEVSPGKMLALCGLSGMGKSTLIKLMQRLYDPTEGRVTLDGVNLKDIDVNWYRQRVGYCPQEPALFDRSIAENIAFGLNLVKEGDDVEGSSSTSNSNGNGGSMMDGAGSKRWKAADEVTMKDVIRAAMLSNAHDFIQTLPEGYETKVGAGGVLLSGGQRQRIAIARAVIRDPRIILLDEPTNQLDSESEGAIQVAIENLLPSRSVVVIAHRMSTIRRADCIAVIHHGRIVQVGTHEELLQDRVGKYAKLLQDLGQQHNPQFPHHE